MHIGNHPSTPKDAQRPWPMGDVLIALLVTGAAIAMLLFSRPVTGVHIISAPGTKPTSSKPARRWATDFGNQVLNSFIKDLKRTSQTCTFPRRPSADSIAEGMVGCSYAIKDVTATGERGLAWMDRNPAPACIEFVTVTLRKHYAAQIDGLRLSQRSAQTFMSGGFDAGLDTQTRATAMMQQASEDFSATLAQFSAAVETCNSTPVRTPNDATTFYGAPPPITSCPTTCGGRTPRLTRRQRSKP